MTNNKDKKRSGLGKGLESIFGDNVEKVLNDIENNSMQVPGQKESEIPVEELHPNPYQPRKEFDPNSLKELADSIRQHGIFTPLLVKKSVSGYYLITGERRLRAAKLAGLKTVPAIIVDFSEEQMMEIAILENVQRENLNPIEEAVAYDSLMKKFNYTQEELAKRVGKTREYCANILRLLNLPVEVRQMVVDQKLAMGHVRALLPLKDEQLIIRTAKKTYQDQMSVREVEEYVKKLMGSKSISKPKKEKDPIVRDLEHRLSDKLGTKVNIQRKKLTISYTNTKDLNRILELLNLLNDD